MHGVDEWDSVNFALSLVQFDVLGNQPHPPGQIVYVCLLRLVNLFTKNELLTLSLSSAVCGSLALVPYYFTLRQIFRPAIALGASVLTAFTFGYWLTSLRMISDPVAGLFVYGTVCVLLVGLKDRRCLFLGMLLCGITLGIKQTAVYFLAPFAIMINLVVLIRNGPRRPLLASAIFAFVVAAWLWPTVVNCHGWTNYLGACRAIQRENYANESIIFHLSQVKAELQARHDFIQPWGSWWLAVTMLILTSVGVVLCARRDLKGLLFLVFGLSVTLYAYFFLYRFNKYYIYYVPIYCAFAAAGVFTVGDLLARWLHQPLLRHWVPGFIIGLITVANVGLTGPLLPKIAHFRAPPQAALEALSKLPGVNGPPLLLTDDGITTHQLLYSQLRNKVNLLAPQRDLHEAAAALNASGRVYLLSSLPFKTVDGSSTVRLLGIYGWPNQLFELLQGREELRKLSLYEVTTPLSAEYDFAETTGRAPLVAEGMSEDGWCGPDTRFLVPCDSNDDLLQITGSVPAEFKYRYPLGLVCRFAGSPPVELTIEHPGRFDLVLPVPAQANARVVEVELTASQTRRPTQLDAKTTDNRELSVHLDTLECVTADHPLAVHCAEGWYPEESDGASRWRWGMARTTLSVLANQPGTLVIEAAMLSMAEENSVRVLVDQQLMRVDPLNSTEWKAIDWHLPIGRGLHQITIQSQLSPAHPTSDPRELAFRMKSLRWRLDPVAVGDQGKHPLQAGNLTP